MLRVLAICNVHKWRVHILLLEPGGSTWMWVAWILLICWCCMFL
uniref:Uncharacterized protein n=1 Tax=Zea mays TaxID=4577 RepID=C4J2A1_MAIZE|nr:unknown [Zea mays]